MTDWEKVIKRIDELLDASKPDDFLVLPVFDTLEVLKDARELLNAQKPTTVDVDANAEPYWKATCGGCKEPLSLFAAPIIEVMNFAKFCPHCGRPLNWLPHHNKGDEK